MPWQVEDLPQPFNALSYLMVARYAVQATEPCPHFRDKTIWALQSSVRTT